MNNANVAIATTPLMAEKPAFSVLLKPVSSNQEILKAWENYNQLKAQLLDDSDFCEVSGQSYPRKSAFRKLGLAFGVSIEIISENRLELDNGVFAYEVTAKAISPNGRFMTAVGSAHSNERKYAKSADVRAIAQTRSTNRAISDLIGGVLGTSAEEMISEAPVSNYQAKETLLRQPAEEQASDRQKQLIISLVDQRVYNEEIKSRYLSQLGQMTKTEASDLIKQLIGS